MPKSDTSEEFLTRERCFIRERINDPDIAEFSLADCRVEPGVITELHCLDVDEWYLIVAGKGSVEVDGQAAYRVGPGDTVSIPRGVSQRIENVGQGDLRFQCICIPRFKSGSYQPLE